MLITFKGETYDIPTLHFISRYANGNQKGEFKAAFDGETIVYWFYCLKIPNGAVALYKGLVKEADEELDRLMKAKKFREYYIEEALAKYIGFGDVIDDSSDETLILHIK